MIDLSRPKKLYRYSERQWLEKSILFGEFRIVPASVYCEIPNDLARQDNELVREYILPGDEVKITHLKTGMPIKPKGDVVYQDQITTNYFVLCFSTSWSNHLFDEFKDSDSCLVIHYPEEVCNRIHIQTMKFLENWIGIDKAVSYYKNRNIGPALTKNFKYKNQKEWRFVWLPPKRIMKLIPFYIRIGNIERFAEIVSKPK